MPDFLDDAPINLETRRRMTTFALGDYSSLSDAQLSSARITTSSQDVKRVLIQNSNLTDCDLTLTDWSWFKHCRIIGGHLPTRGNIREANGCYIVHESLKPGPVMIG